MATWQTDIELLANGMVYVSSGNRRGSYYGKFWVAEISGLDPKFGFSRSFVSDRDGATLEPGKIYEVFRSCTYAKRPESYFIAPRENGWDILDKKEVIGMF
jgi:hypothetical protein